MPRKTKRTYQKQKQQQVQKVIVNVGEKAKAKRKRRARRPKEPSQDAQEYSQAISQIIPRIQYNFPQHSSFNYDAYQTPNVVPQTRPADLEHPISLLKPQSENQKENLAQQKDTGFTKSSGFKDPDFVVNKPQPNQLNIKKPEPSSTMGREIAINHPDRLQSLTDGLKPPRSFVAEMEEEEENVKEAKEHIQTEKKKLATIKRPSNKAIIEELNSRGLAETPENKKKIIDEYLKRREQETASQLRRERKQRLETWEKKLERTGMISRMKSRPRPTNPILEEDTSETVPLMENKKIVTLADLQAKATQIAKSQKQNTDIRTIMIKPKPKPKPQMEEGEEKEGLIKKTAKTVGGVALEAGKAVGGAALETGKEVGKKVVKEVLTNVVKSIF
jgi:hypothetical protein